MTDATGNTPSNAAKPRKPTAAGAAAGGPRVGPETSTLDPSPGAGAGQAPAELGVSRQGDMSSPSAARLSKAKSPPTLSEEESVVLAGYEAAQERTRALREWAWVRGEEARDAVRTHPLGSSVIIFGAGMIFGLLLARR